MRAGRTRTCVVVVAGLTVGVLLTLGFGPRAGLPPSLDAMRYPLAERAMDRPIDVVELNGVPFEDGMAELGRLWDVEIAVDWPSLAGTPPWDRKAPIFFRGRAVTLAETLAHVLRPQSKTSPRPTYRVEAGRVLIVGPTGRQDEGLVRVYDVADLLTRADEFPEADGAHVLLETSDGTRPEPTPAERLIRLLSETVDPDHWRDNGGSSGAAQMLGGRLVVTTTWANHREVRALLESIRSPAAGVPLAPSGQLLHVWDDRVKQWVGPRPDDIERVLEARTGELALAGVDFRTAMTRIAEKWGVPLQVEEDRQDGADVRRHVAVTVRLSNPSLAEALDAILDIANSVSGDTDSTVPSLQYRIDRGVILIVAGSERAQLVRRIYDLRPWLRETNPDRSTKERAATRLRDQQAAFEVIKTIQTVVEPDRWRENGGSHGQTSFESGLLIVEATRRMQAGVAELLAQLCTGVTVRQEPRRW